MRAWSAAPKLAGFGAAGASHRVEAPSVARLTGPVHVAVILERIWWRLLLEAEIGRLQ
jgi:hypothetical protein